MSDLELRPEGAPAVQLTRIRADNPGPLTLTGTNTYVLRDGEQLWVVDPGPRDPEHLADVLVACGDAPRPSGVIVTHHHADHAAGAATLARQLTARTGTHVPLWSADPMRVPGSRRAPSALMGDNGAVAHIIHLPGHTDDSLGLLVEGGRMLTGDTVLGGSSTVIIPEHGGTIAEHLQCLAILRAFVKDGRIASIHPGHGDPIPDPLEALRILEDAIAHRRERVEQVRRARMAGILTMDRLLRAVYGPQLPPALADAARWNLRAALEHISAGY